MKEIENNKRRARGDIFVQTDVARGEKKRWENNNSQQNNIVISVSLLIDVNFICFCQIKKKGGNGV